MFDVATIQYVADTRGLRDARTQMDSLDRTAGRVSNSARALGRAVGVAFTALTATLTAAVTQFTRLESSVAEVITLFERNQLGDLGFTETSRIIQREIESVSYTHLTLPTTPYV